MTEDTNTKVTCVNVNICIVNRQSQSFSSVKCFVVWNVRRLQMECIIMIIIIIMRKSDIWGKMVDFGKCLAKCPNLKVQ